MRVEAGSNLTATVSFGSSSSGGSPDMPDHRDEDPLLGSQLPSTPSAVVERAAARGGGAVGIYNDLRNAKGAHHASARAWVASTDDAYLLSFVTVCECSSCPLTGYGAGSSHGRSAPGCLSVA